MCMVTIMLDGVVSNIKELITKQRCLFPSRNNYFFLFYLLVMQAMKTI